MQKNKLKIVKLPEDFTLSNGYENDFIKSINQIFYSKQDIALNFSEIAYTTKQDIMVLVAQIEKAILFKQKKIYRIGGMPKKRSINHILRNLSDIKHFNKSFSSSSLVEADHKKLLDTDLIDNTVSDLKKIGIKEYYHPFYEFLQELIANAVEHGLKQRNINWWFTFDQDNKSRTRRYTFVDMGQGIAKTHRNSGLPWNYLLSGDSKIVADSFKGELVSSTKLDNRGKGLPQLLKMSQQGLISDLCIITNKVSLSLDQNGIICRKNINFDGTFYTWSISKKNFEEWKRLK